MLLVPEEAGKLVELEPAGTDDTLGEAAAETSVATGASGNAPVPLGVVAGALIIAPATGTAEAIA